MAFNVNFVQLFTIYNVTRIQFDNKKAVLSQR